jgi:hypothetical protein
VSTAGYQHELFRPSAHETGIRFSDRIEHASWTSQQLVPELMRYETSKTSDFDWPWSSNEKDHGVRKIEDKTILCSSPSHTLTTLPILSNN